MEFFFFVKLGNIGLSTNFSLFIISEMYPVGETINEPQIPKTQVS